MNLIIGKLRKTGLFNNVSIGDEKQLKNSIGEFLEKNPTFELLYATIDESQSIHLVFGVTHKYNVIGLNYSWAVLSAYHNGISDRTTYNGLHRGDYDNTSLAGALKIAKKRADGKCKVIECYSGLPLDLDFIPNKYRIMLEKDSYKGSKEDGYWLYLKHEYFCDNTGCRTVHEYTQKDVLNELKSCRPATEND